MPTAVAPGVHPAGDEVRAVLGGRLPDPADVPASDAATTSAVCADLSVSAEVIPDTSIDVDHAYTLISYLPQPQL